MVYSATNGNRKVLTAINKPESLRQEVYERIKEAILTNQFDPGQKLDEVRIGEMLGVSRTPVREALNRLAQENLAVSEINRGVYVARVTPQELIEILEIREVLEGLAGRLFTETADAAAIEALKATMQPFTIDTVEKEVEKYNLANVQFHSIIVNGTGKSHLINSIEALYDHLSLAKSMRLISLTKRPVRSFEEHLRIIDAVVSGDAELTERLMRAHIHSLKNDVMLKLYAPSSL